MKDILVILALSLFSACHDDAQLGSGKGKNDLSGPVHTVRVEKSPLVKEGGRYVPGPAENSEVTYDGKGNKTEELKYKADNSIVSRSVFEYDTTGNLTAVTVYNADGSIYLKRVRKSIQVMEGRRVEESILASGTTLYAKTFYTLDNQDRAIELAGFDANGKPGARVVTIYGANGKPTEVEFSHNTSVTGKVIFSYDAQGNQTEHVEYDAAGVRGTRYAYTGDLKRGSHIETAEYDANDNLVNKETYIREFDSHGNWIKETKSKLNLRSGKFEPVEVTRRIITYY